MMRISARDLMRANVFLEVISDLVGKGRLCGVPDWLWWGFHCSFLCHPISRLRSYAPTTSDSWALCYWVSRQGSATIPVTPICIPSVPLHIEWLRLKGTPKDHWAPTPCCRQGCHSPHHLLYQKNLLLSYLHKLVSHILMVTRESGNFSTDLCRSATIRPVKKWA